MELVVFSPTQAQPLPPVEWNYPELKKWIEDGLAKYKGVVYDETQIAEAKRDRASLRKLAEVIDSKRREMKTLYLQPYMEFEAQAKELVAMIKQQADEIDAQVKAYDDFRKQEKLEKIKAELYTPMIDGLGDLVPYEKLHESRWLNVSCSVSTIGTEMAQKIERIISGLEAIDKLDLDDALTEQTKAIFLKDFDLAAAIKETERILEQRAALEKLRADAEARKAAATEKPSAPKYTPAEPSTSVVEHPAADVGQSAIHTEDPIQLDFRVWVTKQQMAALREFLQTNRIKYGRVPTA